MASVDHDSSAPFRPCILIPTFNNAGTLGGVLSGLDGFDLPILVVDDGSSDQTARVIAHWLEGPHRAARSAIRHPRNRGKAGALRTGFAAAAGAGCTHAATIDSDGQHDPAQIPRLIEAARANPNALVLGARQEHIEHCPVNSLRARKVANALTALECGRRLSDTQCGFRVYPLDLVASVRCRSQRYGFEAEIISRAVWAGCPVVEVPIDCVYFAPDRRVSHFQPYRDSARQLRMHAALLLRAMNPWPHSPLRAAPRAGLPSPGLARAAWRWISPARLWQEMRTDPATRPHMALAVALGVLIGNLPPGMHSVLALYLARRLHLHPIPALLGTQVGFPPFLVIVQIAVGHMLLTGSWPRLDGLSEHARAFGPWALAGRLTAEYSVGMVVVGAVSTILAFLLTRWMLRPIAARKYGPSPPGTPRAL